MPRNSVTGEQTWIGETAGRLADGYLYENYQDNIVANAGGGQTNATQLIAQTSRITTVATSGDSVKLQPAQPGLEITVINHGANPMQVYGAGTDTIDDIAAATGVSQMQSSCVLYFCVTAGSWYSEGLAIGWGGPGLQTVSSVDGLTAHAGGGQALGTALNYMQNRFTTVATIGDSGTLPANTAGLQICVFNAGANSMNVFPPTGGQINGAGANVAFALAAGKNAQFSCLNSAGNWHAILSA